MGRHLAIELGVAFEKSAFEAKTRKLPVLVCFPRYSTPRVSLLSLGLALALRVRIVRLLNLC
jgi:hypothetical protein